MFTLIKTILLKTYTESPDVVVKILDHHGSLTVGKSLWEAYLRLEKVEHTAQITLAAQQLGQVGMLSPQAVEKLAAKRRDFLQREGRDICEGCSVCVLGDEQEIPTDILSLQSGPAVEAALVRQIAESVVRTIQKPDSVFGLGAAGR